jgi:hypothetical protein
MTAGRVDQLWTEVVYIAYHLHWSYDSILDLDNFTRVRVIEEISGINDRVNNPERQD